MPYAPSDGRNNLSTHKASAVNVSVRLSAHAEVRTGMEFPVAFNESAIAILRDQLQKQLQTAIPDLVVNGDSKILDNSSFFIN
ncbi:hypothetical protein ACQFX9_22000 [Aliinostoc sp. HNIBRCY26]|uniref:hypothetical protein n=1 Tax=Aliinostoc sp. HNIBRCY26 TaxID=3418997 RepID=UPI003CFCC52F